MEPVKPIILAAALALTAGFGLGWCSRPQGNQKALSALSDTVEVVRVVNRVEVDTLYILSPQPCVAWVDRRDTVQVTDSCRHLREYREYRDSAYYVRVSGVRPRLDEIRVYPRTVYRTEYVTREMVHRAKRWGVGLSAGYGVGSGGLSPVVAVTVNYNLWNF